MRLAALLCALACGCGARSSYPPTRTVRAELVLRYRDGYELVAADRVVARSLAWRGLAGFVRCVPDAHAHATSAARHGRAAIALGALAITFGSLGLAGLTAAAADHDDAARLGVWLGSGFGLGVLGALGGWLSRLERNRANGHAVDAMNFYDDAVGSVGGACDGAR
jgi:hypothetical protein